MRTYTFADLATYSQAPPNQVKNWVQTRIIRPDVHDTSGSGSHRKFSFLDVLEACIATKLYELPGSMPTAHVGWALDVLRIATQGFRVAHGTTHDDWRRFLLGGDTRDPQAHFWLCKSDHTSMLWHVVADADRDDLRQQLRGAVILVPLHTLVLELEARTQDRASADECARAFSKEVRKKQREALERPPATLDVLPRDAG